MPFCVFRLRRESHEVLRRIVPFIAVNVVYDFAFPQRTAEFQLRDDTVLVPAIPFLVILALAFAQLCVPQF